MGSERVRKAAVFWIIQLVLVFLLLEVVLRLLQPHLPGLRVLLHQSSDAASMKEAESLEELLELSPIGFAPGKPRAGHRRNSRGFRTGEYTGPRQPGSLRIMGLGDSFTDASGGVPYSDMWTSVLQRELGLAIDKRVEVFGLGVPGFGPALELRLWELEHEVVRPDLVVLAFFVGNDFPRRSGFGAFGRYLSSYSLSLRVIRNYFTWRRDRAGLAREDGAVMANRPGSSEESDRSNALGLFLEVESKRFELVLDTFSKGFDESKEALGGRLREADAKVRESGQRLVVMIIPDEFQVNQELENEIVEYLEVTRADYDLDLPQRWLTGFLRQQGTLYLDLLPAFRQGTRTRRLYWARNTHWNSEGHRLAGELLARFLIEEKLVGEHSDRSVSPIHSSSGS